MIAIDSSVLVDLLANGPEAESAEEPTTAEAEEAPKPKKKTRRGSRGGKNRKKKPAAQPGTAVQDPNKAAGNAAENDLSSVCSAAS